MHLSLPDCGFYIMRRVVLKNKSVSLIKSIDSMD